MQKDINMGWKSSIPVGAFVVISYGEVNTDIYKERLKQDLEYGTYGYNSTLWQKIYDENTNINNGISYRLIMSMAGEMPEIEFVRPIIVLDADQEPDIIVDKTDPTNPKITFCLPQAQVMGQPSAEAIGPLEDPSVTIDNTDINHPKLKFKLPKAVQFYEGDMFAGKGQETFLATDPSFADYNIGDYYISRATGNIYVITDKSGNTCTFKYITCLNGEALHIVRSYLIDDQEDTFANGLSVLQQKYTGPYSSDELIAVTFKNQETGDLTSYWYYYTDDKQWHRVKLTGSVASTLISNVYVPEGDENRAYSITYINELFDNFETNFGDKIIDIIEQNFGDILSIDKLAGIIENLVGWHDFKELSDDYVPEKTLIGIEVTKNPNKMTYEVGDTLNTEGIVVTAKYSDGSTRTDIVPSYSPLVLNTVGNQTITVSYEE